MWYSAQWRALSTKIYSEVNLSAVIYRLFHKDFSSIIGTNTAACSQSSVVGILFQAPQSIERMDIN